jgi:hypothetical protein
MPAGELERMTQLRRHCLDELERRNRDAFDRWLADRHAAEDPTRFFHDPSRR